MYAALDIGNTFGKLGLFEKGEIQLFQKGKVSELEKTLAKEKPQALIICSVTLSKEEIENKFVKFSKKIILGSTTPSPIINGYKTAETLGYDRLAAAVGSYTRSPKTNNLIIDLGTAAKYDFLNKSRVFKGGMIGPGLQMRFKALHTFTKKLPLVESNGIPDLIGNSTTSCIQSGVINGMLAEINGIIENYQSFGELSIFLSGGDADLFDAKIKYPTFATPNLVLEGLNRILEYNVDQKELLL